MGSLCAKLLTDKETDRENNDENITTSEVTNCGTAFCVGPLPQKTCCRCARWLVFDADLFCVVTRRYNGTVLKSDWRAPSDPPAFLFPASFCSVCDLDHLSRVLTSHVVKVRPITFEDIFRHVFSLKLKFHEPRITQPEFFAFTDF